MRHGGWSGPMVSSVQRTEVDDVASLFIGCDMKKRSAYKILLVGATVLCGLSAGHCGRVSLQGSAAVSMRGAIVVEGYGPYDDREPYAISVGCAVCAGYHGPCVSTPPSDTTVGSRSNVRTVYTRHANNGMGYSGNYVYWEPANPGRGSWVDISYTCDNKQRPDWTWVNVGFYRHRYSPLNRLRVVATNLSTGATTEQDLGLGYGGAGWRPWPSVHPEGDTGRAVNVSVSYPELVVLRGKGAKTRMLYDIQGNAPLYVRIDKTPKGLSCTRLSDGVTIGMGVSAAVGVGDSLMCTNVQSTAGETSGTLSITAMVR